MYKFCVKVPLMPQTVNKLTVICTLFIIIWCFNHKNFTIQRINSEKYSVTNYCVGVKHLKLKIKVCSNVKSQHSFMP